MMSDRYINMALLYLFRKGTEEVKEFNSAAIVRKHMFEMDGLPDLEIVLSVSGNFNVFTEKFLRKERIYWVKNT